MVEVYGVKEAGLGPPSPTLKVQKKEDFALSAGAKKEKLKTSKPWFFTEYPEE